MREGLEWIGGVLLLFLAAGGLGCLASLFNSLVQVKNNIGKAWKNIDVLLLQRNEELPKLIGIVKGYMQHERAVFESIAELRARYGQAAAVARRTEIENEMGRKIVELRAVWEGYPALKADELFLKTQRRISEIESEIADRRTFFNDTVRIYNTQIEQVPQALFAKLLRYKAHPYLETPAGILRH